MRFPDPRLAIPAACALVLSGCSVMEGSGRSGGSTLTNLLVYGSTTEPPVQRQGDVEASACPDVLVIDGRAAVKQGGAQISISNLARECTEKPDGTIVVKVGLEGLALLGQGGGGGRFTVPVVFQIRQGDRVVVTRTRQASVAVSPGTAQGAFVVVEPGMAVPPKSGDFDIEVGLGGGSGRASRR
jgi:hypothetical protein